MSYYMAINELMFRRKNVFVQNMTLTDLHEMLPYEFAIYVNHIASTVEEYRKNPDK